MQKMQFIVYILLSLVGLVPAFSVEIPIDYEFSFINDGIGEVVLRSAENDKVVKIIAPNVNRWEVYQGDITGQTILPEVFTADNNETDNGYMTADGLVLFVQGCNNASETEWFTRTYSIIAKIGSTAFGCFKVIVYPPNKLSEARGIRAADEILKGMGIRVSSRLMLTGEEVIKENDGYQDLDNNGKIEVFSDLIVFGEKQFETLEGGIGGSYSLLDNLELSANLSGRGNLSYGDKRVGIDLIQLGVFDERQFTDNPNLIYLIRAEAEAGLKLGFTYDAFKNRDLVLEGIYNKGIHFDGAVGISTDPAMNHNPVLATHFNMAPVHENFQLGLNVRPGTRFKGYLGWEKCWAPEAHEGLVYGATYTMPIDLSNLWRLWPFR